MRNVAHERAHQLIARHPAIAVFKLPAGSLRRDDERRIRHQEVDRLSLQRLQQTSLPGFDVADPVDLCVQARELQGALRDIGCDDGVCVQRQSERLNPTARANVSRCCHGFARCDLDESAPGTAESQHEVAVKHFRPCERPEIRCQVEGVRFAPASQPRHTHRQGVRSDRHGTHEAPLAFLRILTRARVT